MIDDFNHVKQLSASGGLLSRGTGICRDINDGLTAVMDHFIGPNVVDSFDASCNTCKFFERHRMNPEEKRQRNIFGMPGVCTKFDAPVVGWQRGQYCGFENAACYENRRTGMRPTDAFDGSGGEVI